MEEFLPLVENYYKEIEYLFSSTSSLFRFSKNLESSKA